MAALSFLPEEAFAWGGVRLGFSFVGGRATGAESLGYDSVAFRQIRMLEKNAGYNISPENWFSDFNSIGREGTFITDYRAIGEILGPVRADTQFNIGYFTRGNIVSYFKIGKLEQTLGLEYGSLSGGFRFSRISKIDQMHPRSPLVGNSLFTKPGQGLPRGGPELVIDPVSTNPWPRRIRDDD